MAADAKAGFELSAPNEVPNSMMANPCPLWRVPIAPLFPLRRQGQNRFALGAMLGVALGLSGCAAPNPPSPPTDPSLSADQGNDTAEADSSRTADVEPPYKVNGTWYHPQTSAQGYREVGLASWYGREFHGQRTASGAIYNMHQPTAAHRTLPLPTLARVTNLENGRSTRVRINDRGPFVDTDKRIIDLSYEAARRLGIDETGIARVRVVALKGPSRLTSSTRTSQATGGTQKPSSGPGDAALYLQIGAFRQASNAMHLKKRLRGMELGRVVITLGHYEGDPLYRVRIGPLASVTTADRLAQHLRQKGMPTGALIHE